MFSQTLFVAPTLRVSSPLSPLAVPSICISPAADAYPALLLEPTSPKDALSPRASHLLPPPILSPLRRSLAPKALDKKGLDQSTFEDLLLANRERTAKRSVNVADRLRREVVVKAHHSKQYERRALFLSRIAAPPSPHSTETAVTPPESPAVFHFTLPSPGLASPLELFETVRSRASWTEHVDYNNAKPARGPPTPFSARLPSLDQITARLRPTLNTQVSIPSVVVEAPTAVVLPVCVIKGDRQDEVKPRSRLPDSIRASTRARSASPPTPTPAPTSTAPSQLIIPRSPPKSIRPVAQLVPQSIPALRINNKTHNTSELAPVPVMSWRDRAPPTPTSIQTQPRKESLPRKEQLVSMGAWKEPQTQSGTWRDAAPAWREVPIKREVVRNTGVPPISPRTVVPLPIGMKPAPPIPSETRPKTMIRRPAEALTSTSAPAANRNGQREGRTTKTSGQGTLRMDVAPTATSGADGLATSRRSALWRVQRGAAGAVKLTESERRAVQGRNMVDKLRRRTSAPAELEGTLRRAIGVPVGGF